jgi:ParB family transcriptional regulator, chromosome partitioning protein
MQLLMLLLSLLEEDPHDHRQERDQDADDDLRESLARDGQLNPLRVTPIGDGKYRIIAGTRRKRQMEVLGWTEALCQIVEADEKTLAKQQLLDNLQRLNPENIDTAIYATNLMTTYRWTQTRLARELSVREGVVSRWVTMANKLTPELRSSGLPSRTLYLLASKVKNPEDQLALAKRVKDEHLTVEQLSKILSKAPQKTPKTTFKVKSGKVTVESSSVLDALAEALAQAKRS